MASFPTPSPTPPTGGRSVNAGQGLVWLQQGWTMFLRNPGTWVIIALVLLIIQMVLAFIPVIGSLASCLLSPVFVGGLLLGCRALDNGGELRFEHLFAGFSGASGPLVTVGALFAGGMLAIFLITFLVGGGAALTGFAMGRSNAGVGVATAFSGIMLAGLLYLALSIPLLMAYWFAPALVLFKDMRPIDAMKASFSASLNNILPFFIYGIVCFVLMVVAMIPFGLGLLVLFPWLVASLYASYVDIFE